MADDRHEQLDGAVAGLVDPVAERTPGQVAPSPQLDVVLPAPLDPVGQAGRVSCKSCHSSP